MNKMASPSLSSSSSDNESPQLETVRTAHTNRSRDSVASPHVETKAERVAREPVTYTRSCNTSAGSGGTTSWTPEFEVYFQENDPENPMDWPLWYRCWCIFCVSFATWVATLYSTSYTSSTPGLINDFDSSTTIVTLGMTTYLLGLAAGTLVVAPLSELYGRRPVYIVCLALWAALIVPCGLAQSLTTIIVVRFFG